MRKEIIEIKKVRLEIHVGESGDRKGEWRRICLEDSYFTHIKSQKLEIKQIKIHIKK